MTARIERHPAAPDDGLAGPSLIGLSLVGPSLIALRLAGLR